MSPSIRSDGGAPATSSRSLAPRSTTCSSQERSRAARRRPASRPAPSGDARGPVERGARPRPAKRPAPSSEAPSTVQRSAQHRPAKRPAPSSEAPSTVQRSAQHRPAKPLVIAPEQRLVEKAGQRRDAAKHRHERCIETRTGRQGGREFASGEKLPELEELGGLVIPGKAARHALQAFALEPADLSPEPGRFDNRAQALH